MTLTTTPRLAWPQWLPNGSISQVTALNGATEKFGYIFEAPQTGTLTGVSFRTMTVTTGCTVDVRLETIGTDGFPSGSLVSASTNITQVINDTDDNTWFSVTFTSGASVTRGTRYALVFAVSSGTPSGLQLAVYGTGNNAPLFGGPWYGTYNGSAWTYGSAFSVMAGVLNYGGTYPYSIAFVPGVTQSTTTFNNGSTPDVRGIKFTLPVPAKLRGFQFFWDADGTAVFKLYDSDGVTVLDSVSISDADYPPTTNARVLSASFSSSITLTAGASYRLGIEPDTATSVGIGEIALGNSAWYTALPFETYATYTSAKDPTGTGSWTDSTSTVMPVCMLIFDAFDDGAGSGSSVSFSFGF